jgi:hypothetical protein
MEPAEPVMGFFGKTRVCLYDGLTVLPCYDHGVSPFAITTVLAILLPQEKP